MSSAANTFTTISSRDFARDLARAKRAAVTGPVFVTDRGTPTYALLKIEDYYRLAGRRPQSLLELMDGIAGGDFEFEPPRLRDTSLRDAELD